MIPLAVRRGAYVFTSTLDGENENGFMDTEPLAQLEAAFGKLPGALASVGAKPSELVAITIAIADDEYAAVAAELWRSIFGERGGGPAARITTMALPFGHLVHIFGTAIVGASRQSVPPPAGMPDGTFAGAARCGDLCVTSALDGRRADGSYPTAIDDEIAQAFDNVAACVIAAGGTSDDLLHYWAFAAPGIVAGDFTQSWLARFPLAGQRPARKTFLNAPLIGPARVVLQATALIGGGARSNYEVPWVRHKDPLPMAARIGDLFMSSGLLPNVPDPEAATGIGPIPPTLEEQLVQSIATLAALLAERGGHLSDVACIGAVLKDYTDLPRVNAFLCERFGTERMPAVQLWSLPLAVPEQVVQLFATAVFG
jgi:enamine deaminase RidA (YjgF/YER057c/UK114 family)